MEYQDEVGFNDDPFDSIMNEGAGDSGEGGGRHRYINQVGKTGRYVLGGFKELDDAEVDKLKPEEKALYLLEQPLAERKKFKAIILYNPEDVGRALWPDGRHFQGNQPLCQSERSIAPFDTARTQHKMAPMDKLALKGMGHTGACSTCKIGTDLCKVRNVAYVIDLDHVKAINDYNKANPNADPMMPTFSKLDAKGPQSTWNFRSKYRELINQAKKAGKTLGDFIVEFSAEAGNQGSHKLTFRVVSELAADDPLRPMIRLLAREALEASKTVRKSFTALPTKTEVQALPPGQTETADGIIIPDEIPF